MTDFGATKTKEKRRQLIFALLGVVLALGLVFLGWTLARVFDSNAPKTSPTTMAQVPKPTLPTSPTRTVATSQAQPAETEAPAVSLAWQDLDAKIENEWGAKPSQKMTLASPNEGGSATIPAKVSQDWGLSGSLMPGVQANALVEDEAGFGYRLPLKAFGANGEEAYWRMEFLPILDVEPLYNLAHLNAHEALFQRQLEQQDFQNITPFRKMSLVWPSAGNKSNKVQEQQTWLHWEAQKKTDKGQRLLWQWAKESPEGGIYIFTLDLPNTLAGQEKAKLEQAFLHSLANLDVGKRQKGARLYADEALNLQYFVQASWQNKPENKDEVSAQEPQDVLAPIKPVVNRWELTNGKEIVFSRWENRPEQVNTLLHMADYVEAQAENYTKGMQAKNTIKFEHRGTNFSFLKFAVRTRAVPVQADIASFILENDSYQISIYGPYQEDEELSPEMTLLVRSLRPLHP